MSVPMRVRPLSFVATRSHMSSVGVVATVWQSRAVELVRARLFYEFALFILGGGNALFLLLFWPGWVLVGFVLWALSSYWAA
ncbi:hypothetical protein XA68_17944 [Ophiocordyceps unilateralis]|uniref:Uncharacterized protein n=1 Tax=Ophiocordyceps unilateralis TaxID=268505 RepID=A0A2A9P3Z7_OPHUN|nr:hypothetical protein XA68_17944 [Ophiocordyceps unilateralis]